MKKGFLALVLALVMALGLAVPAMAYSTPDFSDVPQNHWAYEAVMKMADAGVIKGTGNGQFSPDMKLSAEMFVVLVGRVVFPDVEAEGADWSSPYIAEAKAKGLLDGTNVTDANIKGDISRYDMAVILGKCVEILQVSASKADSSKVADYGDIPNRYTDAVLTAYGSGLIQGDQSGKFNGSNSMTRQEAATVMNRLLGLKGGSAQGTTTEPESPANSTEDPLVEYVVKGRVRQTEHAMAAPAFDKHNNIPGATVKLYYTPDGGKTSTLVAEGVTTEGEWRGTPEQYLYGAGEFTFTFEAPESWGDGKNFYVSAEGVYEGQKLVTSDLRTDGRAYKSLLLIEPGPSLLAGLFNRMFNIEMTPPNGEKAKLTYKGYVSCDTPDGERRPEGFTVQLHFKDGTVLGEAVTDSNGNFAMDFEVDALDNPFDQWLEQYYVSAEGFVDGIHFHRTGYAYDTGELRIESLYGLGVRPDGKGGWDIRESHVGMGEHSIVSP